MPDVLGFSYLHHGLLGAFPGEAVLRALFSNPVSGAMLGGALVIAEIDGLVGRWAGPQFNRSIQPKPNAASAAAVNNGSFRGGSIRSGFRCTDVVTGKSNSLLRGNNSLIQT
jgi:hypothetical protein